MFPDWFVKSEAIFRTVRWLLVFILLSIASVQVIPGQGQGSPAKRDESHAQNSKKAKPESSASDTVVEVQQETASAQSNDAKNALQGYFTRLIAPGNLPNIILCFAGIGGIIVAVRTLKAVERQTKATEDSVKSAEKQFSISHRPWCAFAELPKAESALKFDGEGGCLNLSYKIRNGSDTSPAIGVNTVLQFVISLGEVPNDKELRKAFEQLASPDFIKTITESFGVFLLSEAIMGFPPVTVRVYKEPLEKVKGNKISLILITCLAYRDEFGTTIHKTYGAYRFVTNRGERSYQPTGAMNGSFESLGIGYAD